MGEESYAGQELELFKVAVNWKAYFRAKLAPYIKGDVLEVGAGIGGTTRTLCDGSQQSWVCLEPDSALADEIAGAQEPFALPPEVIVGSLDTIASERRFDTILYIDVLEHIEHDAAELELARDHLGDGGVIIVLSPAFQFLFSEFDRAVGHFRRYDKRSLSAAIPTGLQLERLFYLDSIGMLTSLVNRYCLRQEVPKVDQIKLWDRVIVPVSRWIDPLLCYSLGRSIVAVLRKA